MTCREIAASVAERQSRLADEFLFIDEWGDRYQYLIELGKRLPPMPAGLRTECNRLPECAGETFFAGERSDGRLFLHAASDMPVLAGILALIVEIYSGGELAAILRHPPAIFDRTGLTTMLSPHRRVALLRIHERLVRLASDRAAPRRLAS